MWHRQPCTHRTRLEAVWEQPLKIDVTPAELKWDLETGELENLKLVALGCHRSCHDALKTVFREAEVASWSLNDYYLLKPLGRNRVQTQLSCPSGDDVNGGPLRWKEKDRPQLYFPFFERRLRAMPFVADVGPGEPEFRDDFSDVQRSAYLNLLKQRRKFYQRLLKGDQEAAIRHVLDWPVRPNTEEFSRWLRRGFKAFVSSLADDTSGMRLIRRWAYRLGDPLRPTRAGLEPGDRVQYHRHRFYKVWDTVEELLAELTRHEIPDGKPDPAELKRIATDRASARLEHATNDHFWLLHARGLNGAPGSGFSGDGKTPTAQRRAYELAAVSVASDDHFYGYLVVEYPPPPEQPKGGQTYEELRTKIFEVLRQNASAQYLDVLVLFFNQVYEARLRNRLKSSTDTLVQDLALVQDLDPFEALPSELEATTHSGGGPRPVALGGAEEVGRPTPRARDQPRRHGKRRIEKE